MWEVNLGSLANEAFWEVQGTLRTNLASENRLLNMLQFKHARNAHYTRVMQHSI